MRLSERRRNRYLGQRQEQLDYEGAISQGLPIGSGEIENAHRYIVQKRLKLPGVWWTPANAENMLALRVNRANGEWQGYWATNYRNATSSICRFVDRIAQLAQDQVFRLGRPRFDAPLQRA